MSGHSKWSTIKRKKGATDAKRGKIFTRIAREITMAAKEGGGDLNSNIRLRLAVDKAKAANMPKDNIDRAIKRGTGESKEGNFEEAMYEGYAPHGIAVMIECVTENRNRTVADVRHILTRANGTLGEQGSVGWQFNRVAYFSFPSDCIKLISDQLSEANIQPEESELRMMPNQEIELGIEETVQVLKVIEALEELDDVVNVFSNVKISEEALEAME
jgi:transcriptional/translational regulatory protein YebC/TACO1